jgi:hypothetical protein
MILSGCTVQWQNKSGFCITENVDHDINGSLQDIFVIRKMKIPQCILFVDDIVGESRVEINGKLKVWR